MSEEYAKSSDIERLEARIGDLRLAVIFLLFIVILLSVYVFIQIFPQGFVVSIIVVFPTILVLLLLFIGLTKSDAYEEFET